MNQIKRFFVILLIAILVTIQGTMVKAVDATMKVALSSTTTTVSKGQEVTVLVGISDVNVGDGINTFQATLNYDTDVFTSVNIEGTNDWVKQTYNSSKGIFILTYTNMLTSKEQGIAKITFKVKEDTTKTTGKISLTSIEAANPDAKATPSDASITIKIGADNNNNNNNNTNNNNTNNSNTSNNNTNNSNTNNSNTNNNTNNANNVGTTNTNKNNSNSGTSATTNKNTAGANANKSTTSTNTLPKTGIGQWIFVAILAVGIIGIVSYIQYRKYYKVK